MRLALICAVSVLALAACTPPAAEAPPEATAPVAEPAPPPPPPAPVTAPADATAQELINCAGLIAQAADIDPALDPTGPDTPQSLAYWALMALMDKEPTIADARGAVAIAKGAASKLAAPEMTKRLDACKTRFAMQF